MAAGVNGSLVLLQVRTTTGPDVYVTVGGQRGMSVGKEMTAINTSAKDNADGTYIGGRRESTISMEGLVIVGDAGRAALVAAYETNGALAGAVRVRRGAIGADAAKQADGIITDLSEDFPDDEESTWSVEVQISGGWTAVSP